MPAQPRSRSASTSSGSGSSSAIETPSRELLAQFVRPGQVGLDQVLGLGPGKRLESDRARRSDERPVKTIGVKQGGAPLGRLGLRVYGPRLLARAVQDRDPVGPADKRQAGTAREGIQQRGRPDVLVHVGAAEIGAVGLLAAEIGTVGLLAVEIGAVGLLAVDVGANLHVTNIALIRLTYCRWQNRAECRSRSAGRCSRWPPATGSSGSSAGPARAKRSPTAARRDTWQVRAPRTRLPLRAGSRPAVCSARSISLASA